MNQPEQDDQEEQASHDDHGGRPYCNTCSNTGMVNCYCGGDLCVCENQGEMPCPRCGDE